MPKNHRNEKTFVPERLRFCGDCRSANSWKRCPEKDMKYTSGKTLEYAFVCKVCGKITYEPTLE